MGAASIEYLWTNPISGEAEPNTSYVTKVDEVWRLGAGIRPEGEDRAPESMKLQYL